MNKEVYIFEGKTTNEAIEKGLKELKVTKNKVDIRTIESEDKRSFFSILTPRVVKVEIKFKEEKEEKKEIKRESKKNIVEKINNKEIITILKNFLDELLKSLPTEGLEYEIREENEIINIDINGENTGYLIGYRGEVLNSLQTIITNIATKQASEKVKVLLNIGGYRQKRQKDLENLALKIAASVVKTKKSITLEPMPAYERKIIHTKLQENDKIETHSIGEEPYRKIIVKVK